MTTIKPISPADYKPSEQVQLIADMVIDARYNDTGAWNDALTRRFHDGQRAGYSNALRELVRHETGIDDPDVLDGLCDDLLSDMIANRA